MDWLLVWYVVVLCGFLVAIHEPAPTRPERSQARDWVAQLIASSDPWTDYLYEQEESKPMELMKDGRPSKK
jgi:hypothetical protein